MGKLVLVVVVFVAVWTAWWFAASIGLQRGIAKLVEARRASDWQAQIGDVQKLGYPLKLHTRLTDVALSPPDLSSKNGIVSAIAAKRIDISAPTYWPGYAHVRSPFVEFDLSGPNLRAQIGAEDVIADLRLRPGFAGQLDRLSLVGGNWTLELPVAGPIKGTELHVTALQQHAGQPVYDVAIDAAQVTPSQNLRRILGVSENWAAAFETVSARATVTFNQVWDKRALGRARPQPRVIDLRKAELAWGDVSIVLRGNLAVAEDGLLSGALSLQAEDWPTMLNMAEAAGYLPASFRPQAEQMLKALSAMSANPTALDLNISVTDGKMSMGFIPLGRAPRIILR